MCIIELLAVTIDWASYAQVTAAILMAAVGLGFIIFVHELGHFAVAKMCGVKCDKFMIGFDIGGYKIGRQWGDTYYGIGILPLGGYVRMLGQNDDPRMTEEQLRESEIDDERVPTTEILGPDGKMHRVDSRSYIAKSVPQRMAIISAGVVMNMVFAFVFAWIAFGIGVPSMPCIVSATDPGGPAWQVGLRPDDQITRIADINDPWYDQLRNEVTLTSKGEALEVEVRRAASGETVTIPIEPSRQRMKIAQIGVAPPVSLKLADNDPARPFGPAAAVKDQIPAGGRIVAVDGQPMKTYGDLAAVLAANASQPLRYTFETKARKGSQQPEQVEVEIGPNQSEYLGLVMKMGPITAIAEDSPADRAGLQVGDRLVAVNGTPIGMTDEQQLGWNPRTLGERLTELGLEGESVEVEVERTNDQTGKSESFSTTVELRRIEWFEQPFSEKSPASAPALGIAYFLHSDVEGIVPGSPASDTDLAAGDRVLSAKLIVPKKYAKEHETWEEPIAFDEQHAWAYMLHQLQGTPPGSQVELEVRRGESKETRTVTVGVTSDPESYDPRRGIALSSIYETRIAQTAGEQAAMAWDETAHALTSVYRFLNRLISNDIPATALGGPITIAKASYFGAMEGPGRLLLFLTLISANLAVVNFLPIPVLDGGHMVFLIYEGIFRRPANEMIASVMNLAGLVFIVGLMLFVIGLDSGLIPRNL